MSERAPPRGRRGQHFHRSAAALAVVLLAATGVAVWASRTVVHDQNSRLLNDRANEVALVFNTNISQVSTTMAALGEVAGQGGIKAFDGLAAALVTAGPARLTFALVRPADHGYLVVAVAGDGLTVGERVPRDAGAVLAAAQQSSRLVATRVLGHGPERSVGFALAGRPVPAGLVVFRLAALGRVSPPRQAGTAPFQQLRVVLYASPNPDPGQVLVATNPHLPLRGQVRYVPINVGASRWLLAVSATEPLVGSVAAAAPWFVLVVGLVGALLLAVVLEQVLRRRDDAVAMYHGERELAETLQRKLLPTLPNLAGLDVAGRYIAASAGQAVGGDWFDVFDLRDGRAAIVIGDVIGHDIEAAAAMSQVRAALRAYAWEGDEPATVIDRLARLVDAFKMAELLSVVYGVLGRQDQFGARPFQWANAGHLPALLRLPDGEVVELAEGGSRVIGAPAQGPRLQAEYVVPQGSTLVLYTDGLVELPGIALTDSLERVRHALEAQDRETPAENVCESILQAQPTDTSRDDIAIVVARILGDHIPTGNRIPAGARSLPTTPG